MTGMLRVADGVIFKQVGDELVLLDFERGIYYGLDTIGARIWQVIADEKPVGEVVTELLEEYDVDRATLENDITRLLDELREKGLLVRT